MEEIWKRVDIDTDCEVSSEGRFRRRGAVFEPYIHKGYRTVRIGKHICALHRLIANVFIPNPESKPFVDHIDNNKLNNSVLNLRWATPQENNRNSSPRPKSSGLPRGVKRAGEKFVAKIAVNYKTIHIGTFDTVEEASAAYCAKATEIFGEFCHRSTPTPPSALA